MISEIGMDYNQPEATKSFIQSIKTKVRGLAGGTGLGVFYWEPEATPGYNAGYNKESLAGGREANHCLGRL